MKNEQITFPTIILKPIEQYGYTGDIGWFAMFRNIFMY